MTLIGKVFGYYLIIFFFFLLQKLKDISFKIIHKFYPVKHFLSKFKKDYDVSCSLHLETEPHIFWHCSHVKKLWNEVCL